MTSNDLLPSAPIGSAVLLFQKAATACGADISRGIQIVLFLLYLYNFFFQSPFACCRPLAAAGQRFGVGGGAVPQRRQQHCTILFLYFYSPMILYDFPLSYFHYLHSSVSSCFPFSNFTSTHHAWAAAHWLERASTVASVVVQCRGGTGRGA